MGGRLGFHPGVGEGPKAVGEVWVSHSPGMLGLLQETMCSRSLGGPFLCLDALSFILFFILIFFFLTLSFKQEENKPTSSVAVGLERGVKKIHFYLPGGSASPEVSKFL